MKESISNELRKVLINFVKEHNLKLSSPEFVNAIRSFYEYIASEENHSNYFGTDYNLKTPAYKKLCKLHDSIVQQCIDFVKNNQDIQQMIEEKRKLVYADWNSDDSTFEIIPDIRVYFGIDGFDESIEQGKWVASTDSYFSINVGNAEVIDRE